jgi:hypothetical protein
MHGQLLLGRKAAVAYSMDQWCNHLNKDEDGAVSVADDQAEAVAA